MVCGEHGERMEIAQSLVGVARRFATGIVIVLHHNMGETTVWDPLQTQPTVTPTTVQVSRIIFG